MAPHVDPLTIVCEIEIDGKRYEWIGAKALYRAQNGAASKSTDADPLTIWKRLGRMFGLTCRCWKK